MYNFIGLLEVLRQLGADHTGAGHHLSIFFDILIVLKDNEE